MEIINEQEDIFQENNDDDIIDLTNEQDDNFDDVLQLTQYEGGVIHDERTDFVVADYAKIDTTNVDKQTELMAKKFVGKITKFILDFNDVQLTEDHKKYIKQVGLFQLSNLKDMLSLVEINKKMINNIVERVNAVQAEDYVVINAYNNLVNQHIKLLKEVMNLYKSIPTTMKKLRADVLSNQELENEEINNELLTENYGETQFNSSKQMLRALLEKRKNKDSESVNNIS